MTPAALQITVDVPAEVAAGASPVALATELRQLLVLERFRRGELSATRAARVLELGRVAFIELCGTHEIPVIRYELDDFRIELADIRRRGH